MLPTRQVGVDRADALQVEQPTDPVGVADPLVQQAFTGARDPLAIHLLSAGHAYDSANIVIAAIERHQYAQHAARIGAIRLHVLAPPTDLDTGGVEHCVVYAACDKVTMQPEAIIARLVARTDLGRADPILCSRRASLGEQAHESVEITPRQLIQARVPALRQADRHDPPRVTLQRNEDSRCSPIGIKFHVESPR